MRVFLVYIALSLTILQGCVTAKKLARPRYIWPPFAGAAKIEYLGFYASEANFKGPLFGTLTEVVLGVEPARKLFKTPFAIDAWGGRVAITDTNSRKVFVLDMKHRTLQTLRPEQADDDSTGVHIGVAIFDENQLLASDVLGAKVDRFSFDGKMLGSFGKGMLTRPTGLAVDRQHQRIVVVDSGMHRLAFFDKEWNFLGHLGERGSAPGAFNFPLDADFDSAGNLFVLDSMNFRVQRFDFDGENYHYVKQFGKIGTAIDSFSRPKALAISPSGHIYVTDSLAHKVLVFDRDGTLLLNFGDKFIAADGRLAPGGFYMPNGIAVDDQDGIWVVDTLNRMVHHFQYLNEEYLRANPILPGEVTPTGLLAE